MTCVKELNCNFLKTGSMLKVNVLYILVKNKDNPTNLVSLVESVKNLYITKYSCGINAGNVIKVIKDLENDRIVSIDSNENIDNVSSNSQILIEIRLIRNVISKLRKGIPLSIKEKSLIKYLDYENDVAILDFVESDLLRIYNSL